MHTVMLVVFLLVGLPLLREPGGVDQLVAKQAPFSGAHVTHDTSDRGQNGDQHGRDSQRSLSIGAGKFNHPVILSPGKMDLHQKAGGDDAKSQIVEAPGDFQRAGTSCDRLVQLAA